MRDPAESAPVRRKVQTAPELVAVPAVLRSGLLVLLAVAGIVSAPVLGRTGPLPMTVLLDLWIGVLALWMVFRSRFFASGFLFLIVAFFVTRAIPAIYIGAPMTDFLQAHRWIYYLAIAAIALRFEWKGIRGLRNVLVLLVSLSILKAIATRVLVDSSLRPGLLLENNYEIALFCGLAAVLYGHLGRYRSMLVVLIGIQSLLAGSRSGIIAFVLLAIYAVSQNSKNNLFVKYLAFLTIPVAGFLALLLFASRAAGEVRLDRLNFLNIFFSETSNWSALNWIFGTAPITPLSPDACFRLSYYEDLFSSVGDGSCYAVILHAFLLRVVFDAGLIGLVLSFGGTLYVMRSAGVHWSLTLCLLAMALANSASVSGLNNPYVMLPVVFAIFLASRAVQAKSPTRPEVAREHVFLRGT